MYCGEWELWKYTLSLSIAFVVINYIPNLKKLTPFSALANVLTFVGLILTLTYMVQDLPPISDREMFGTLRNFALYFGTTLFALEAIGLVSLPKQFFFSRSINFNNRKYKKLINFLLDHRQSHALLSGRSSLWKTR